MLEPEFPGVCNRELHSFFVVIVGLLQNVTAIVGKDSNCTVLTSGFFFSGTPFFSFSFRFFFFFIPFNIFVRLSRTLLVVTHTSTYPGSYSRLFFPLPTRLRALHFYRVQGAALSSLVDSRLIELRVPTLGALSS